VAASGTWQRAASGSTHPRAALDLLLLGLLRLAGATSASSAAEPGHHLRRDLAASRQQRAQLLDLVLKFANYCEQHCCGDVDGFAAVAVAVAVVVVGVVVVVCDIAVVVVVRRCC
jgi:hypothetical protein